MNTRVELPFLEANALARKLTAQKVKCLQCLSGSNWTQKNRGEFFTIACDICGYEFADTTAGITMLHPFQASSLEDSDPNKQTAGKMLGGVLEDFLPALLEIAKLGSMNIKPNGKYDRGSWMLVKNPDIDYLDAWWRHVLAGRNTIDPESNMPHDVAIAWNSIALVYFRLKREGKI